MKPHRETLANISLEVTDGSDLIQGIRPGFELGGITTLLPMTDEASKHLKQTNTFLVCHVPK